MHDPVFDIFREEAREHLGALEKGFLDLESAAQPEARRKQIDNLFRHAHSLKGDARAIGLSALQESAQTLEDILDALRTAPENVNRQVIDQGLAQLDCIRQAFESWQRALEPEPADEPTAVREVSQPAAQQEAPRAETPPAATALPEESFTVRVPSERLDRMLSLAGELRIVQRSSDDLGQRLIEVSEVLTEMFDACRRLEHALDQEQALSKDRAAVQEELAGLNHRLERCQDQVGRVVSALRKQSTRESLLMETLEADIQQARLLPVTMLADSLRRVVRDLAQSLGKPVRYEVDVGNVLLDKAVLEALREPMLHLVRNAVSHGIETAEERRAAGKPAEGLLRLRASRLGNSVRIHLADDGRGVDYERIRSRVRQTRNIGESELAALTREELVRFLFEPGFTTVTPSARPVGEGAVSGRGVGLDVVLSIVHRLHGSAVLESSSPQGTTFAITVPVSISTIRILTVVCDGQYYGIPSNLIERTGRTSPAQLRELEGCPVLPLNGAPVRWLHLRSLLGTVSQLTPATQSHFPYVLLKQEGPFVAVAVDEMEEEAEVLLKPLGFPLHEVPGIVGAAVRADGSLQIVLDLANVALIKPAPPPQATLPGSRAHGAGASKPAYRILIVDDSPTTRTILRNVFLAAGYAVRTASDGVDALERLRAEPVDLVVSDVEMPRMDGFELTRQVKASHHLPVILVTALEKEEARRKGLEAGADAYVVKSTFQGEGLLEIVKQFE